MADQTAPKKTGHISREQMEAHINRGGAVLYGNEVITKIASLPSEADLAVKSGDQGVKDKTADSLDAEIARLTAERDKLNAAPVQTEPPAPTTPPAEVPKTPEAPKTPEGGKSTEKEKETEKP